MSVAFLPLYFTEEDSEIWEHLQQVEPELRSTFIKKVLRQALKEKTAQDAQLNIAVPVPVAHRPGSEKQTEWMKEKETAEEISGIKTIERSMEETIPDNDPVGDNPVPAEFSLEDLFVSSVLPNQSPDNVLDNNPSPAISAQTSREGAAFGMKGLEHLLCHIIGEEKDDEVLGFFALRGKNP